MIKIKMMLVVMVLVMLSLLANITKAAENHKYMFYTFDKAANKPLADVTLYIHMNEKVIQVQTDTDGNYQIELPYDPNILEFKVRAVKAGYVPQVKICDNFGFEMIGYTFSMEKGTTIGGIIHNEQGRAISGVRVGLLVAGNNAIDYSGILDHEILTDVQGKWRCDIVPAELKNVFIRLTHDDYVCDNSHGYREMLPVETLRAMTGVIVMKKGLVVEGFVTDVDGKPIVGAEVVRGGDLKMGEYPLVRTDAQGYYKFDNCMPGKATLTVSVPDGNGSDRSCNPEYKPTARALAGIFYAPELKEVEVSANAGPINFTLAKGNTLTGRIVDSKGKPIARAYINAGSWRGHRTLSWQGRADENGYFRWDSAPTDEVGYTIGGKGYMLIGEKKLTRQEQAHEVVLTSGLTVRGKVTDITTGKPVPNAEITYGIVWGLDDQVSWQKDLSFTANEDGNYEACFDYPYSYYKVQAKTDIHIPSESRVFSDKEGIVTLDLAIRKKTDTMQIAEIIPGSSLLKRISDNEYLDFVVKVNENARQNIKSYSCTVITETGNSSGKVEIKRQADNVWFRYDYSQKDRNESRSESIVLNDKCLAEYITTTGPVAVMPIAGQYDFNSSGKKDRKIQRQMTTYNSINYLEYCFGTPQMTFRQALSDMPDKIRWDAIATKNDSGKDMVQIRRFSNDIENSDKPNMIWVLDPEKGYLVVETLFYASSDDNLTCRRTIEVEQVADKVWFPVSYDEQWYKKTGQTGSEPEIERWTKAEFKDVVVNGNMPQSQFEIEALGIPADLRIVRNRTDGSTESYVNYQGKMLPETTVAKIKLAEKKEKYIPKLDGDYIIVN